MSDLVQIQNNEVFTTTEIIAEKFELKHAYVLRALENVMKDFDKDKGDFGSPLLFKKIEKKHKNQIYYIYAMNEKAFTILSMRFRTKKAKEWQGKFYDAFEKMQKTIYQIALNQKNNEWLETRKAGKITRKEETETIQKFVEYAESQGSTNAKRYYSNITKMEYKHLYFISGKFKNIRDVLSDRQLQFQATCDEIVKKALIDGMKEGLHYKDIYIKAKNNVMSFADLMPKTKVPELKSLNSKN